MLAFQDNHLLAQKGILGDQLASTSRHISGSAERQTVGVGLSPAFQIPFELTFDRPDPIPSLSPKLTQIQVMRILEKHGSGCRPKYTQRRTEIRRPSSVLQVYSTPTAAWSLIRLNMRGTGKVSLTGCMRGGDSFKAVKGT